MARRNVSHQVNQPRVSPLLSSGPVLQRQYNAYTKHTTLAKTGSDYAQLSKTPQRVVDKTSPEAEFSHDFSQVPIRRKPRAIIQTKLIVGAIGNKYEQEADQVSAQIMRMPAVTAEVKDPVTPLPVQALEQADEKTPRRQSQGDTEQRIEENDEALLEPKEMPGQTPSVTPHLKAQLNSSKGRGQPLSTETQTFMESRFGHDFDQVKIHADSNAAQINRSLHAQAFTHQQDIFFGAGKYNPDSHSGKQLLAHELTHVLQQRDGQANQQTLQRQDIIPVSIITSPQSYSPPGTNHTFRVGDAHGPNILMKIIENSEQGVAFHWYNFHNGIAISGTWRNWNFLALGDIAGTARSRRFTALGQQLTPRQWTALWPNPVPRLMEMYEAGTIRMDDEVVKEAYRGTVAKEARRSLDENESSIDALLDSPERIEKINQYANGLKEASIVRDALEQRKNEIDRRLTLSQQQFHLGLPKRQLMAGLSGPRRLRELQLQAQHQRTLNFWYGAFPLLSRLQTNQINSQSVLATLQSIKASIVATREGLVGRPGRRPTLDPWALQGVRGRLQNRLGAKTRQIVEAEDTSRRRWAWFGAIAGTAAGIALLFLPGGIFIDAAIGIAIAAKSWQEAKEFGHAANTGLHVDAGLMTKAQAEGAQYGAILSTIFAAVGAAASGLRILRSTRNFLRVSRTLPQLSVANRMQLARMFAREPEVLERLAAQAIQEGATLNRIREALTLYGDDVFRARQALKAVSEGFTGDIRRAWTYGLHPDTLAALGRATNEEMEIVARLIRQHPDDASDILRQFTYKARKNARRSRSEFVPPQNVGQQLTESLENLAIARARNFPFGFRSLGQFQSFGRTMRDALRRYGVAADDIRIHGSALSKRLPGDINRVE